MKNELKKKSTVQQSIFASLSNMLFSNCYWSVKISVINIRNCVINRVVKVKDNHDNCEMFQKGP